MRAGAQRRPGGRDQSRHRAGGKAGDGVVDRSRAPRSRRDKIAFSPRRHVLDKSPREARLRTMPGELGMPLTRGRMLGYDDERLAFGFTMLNDGETVDCQISDAAMDELAGVRGSPSTARQALFLGHRD